jgi:hypothetical protein
MRVAEATGRTGSAEVTRTAAQLGQVPSRTCRGLRRCLSSTTTRVPLIWQRWNVGFGNTVRFHPRAEEEQMSETIDAARKLITDRLRELEAEAGRLQRALKSMGESDRSRATPKPRRKRAAGKRRRRSQAPRGRRREQLLAVIGARPLSSPPRSASLLAMSRA